MMIIIICSWEDYLLAKIIVNIITQQPFVFLLTWTERNALFSSRQQHNAGNRDNDYDDDNDDDDDDDDNDSDDV